MYYLSLFLPNFVPILHRFLENMMKVIKQIKNFTKKLKFDQK